MIITWSAAEQDRLLMIHPEELPLPSDEEKVQSFSGNYRFQIIFITLILVYLS